MKANADKFIDLSPANMNYRGPVDLSTHFVRSTGICSAGIGNSTGVLVKVVLEVLLHTYIDQLSEDGGGGKETFPRWLRLSNNKIVQLLHHLDVGNSDQDMKPRGKSTECPFS